MLCRMVFAKIMMVCGAFVALRHSFRPSQPQSEFQQANKKLRVLNLCHPRTVQCLIWLAFMHSGEALNPGPKQFRSAVPERTWSLGAFNPSGLCGKHQVVSSYLSSCDIWAVSETHLTSRGFNAFKHSLQRSGDFQFCVGGSHVPLRPHSDRTGEWSGVCMLSKHPTRQLPVQWPSNTFETSRILLTTTLCADLWITGAVLYGEPQGINHPDAQQNTDDLAHVLLQQLGPIGGLRFIAGDFNFEKGGLSIFQSLEKAGFRDLQDLAFERWGKVPEKTCKLSTRKDFCFISQELQSFLVDVQVDQTVWSDHAVLQGYFKGGSSTLVTHHWRVPSQVKWPDEFQCDLPASWYQHENPDQAYMDLWEHVESVASASRVRSGQLPLPPRCKGRGHTLDVKQKRSPFNSRPTKSGRCGDVQPTWVGISHQHSDWFRQLRRLQAYCRYRKIHHSDTDSAHGVSLWSSILRARGFPCGFRTWWQAEGAKIHRAPDVMPLIPPAFDVASHIYESFLLDVRRLEQTLHTERKKHAVDHRKELAHLVFQDIKSTGPDRVDVLLQVNAGTVTSIDSDNAFVTVTTQHPLEPALPLFIDGVEMDVIHIQDDVVCLPSLGNIHIGSEVRQSRFSGAATELFQAFEEEWKARWDRHKHVPASQWSQICAFIRAHVKRVPCELPPISVQAVRGEILRKKPRSASGLDGHGYRLWSGLRAKFLLAHLHQHCPAFLFGNRPHCQASQVWTHLAWAIESSFVSSVAIGGIIADVEKAFNHLPREVIFHTATALGLPHQILVAWSGALGQLTRRFQIREHTGPALSSSTGCPEGDALSCVAMMLLDFVFHLWFEKSFPLCQPISYVDDLQILAKLPAQIPALFDHLIEFAKLVDLTIDQRKTFVWSNSAYHRASFRSSQFKVRNQARGLGAQLQFTRKHSTQVLSARLESLIPLWPKLRSSPSPYNVKVMAVKQAAWTKGLHGVAASNVADNVFTKLRTHVMQGLVAEGAGCNPVVHLGMIEHPTLDPKCWSILDTFRVVREASSFETLSSLLQSAVEPDSSVPAYSMTALLVDRIHTLGWSVSQGVSVVDSIGEFSLLGVSYQELVLRVCWAWDHCVAAAVAHRKSFDGLSDSDPAATRRFLRSLDVSDQGLFRKALNGAHFTHDAICHWSDTGASVCEFCGAADSRQHRFWECPIFNSERLHCTDDFWAIFPDLPPCLTLHGWALKPSTWKAWCQKLLSLQLPSVEHAPRPFSDGGDWIDVFSDGSCMWPCQVDLRIAAWALVQAHPTGDVSLSQVLMAGPVIGLFQSAFRAELTAIQQALKYAVFWKRRIRIWSDCESAVYRLHTMLNTKSMPAINSPHADLWLDIYESLVFLEFGHSVVITKVAAHQDFTQTTDAMEHWAYVHNTVVDRAARLANLQRHSDFWTLHRAHAHALDVSTSITDLVQTTILKVSRQVVRREAVKESSPDGQTGVSYVAPVMSRPAPPWGGFHPVIPLPLQCTAKYGHRYVAMVTAWFQKGIDDAQSVDARWISIHQLFVDYQFQTGELGPICGKRWIDTVAQSSFRLKPYPFKKRSSWFGRSFRAILRAHSCNVEYAVTRPESALLALHLPSVAIPWPAWRLQVIEDWFARHLPNFQAATRQGFQLCHLPPAKQDDRWPGLSLVVGPLRS